VLAANPEVSVDAGRREPGAKAREPGRPGCRVRLHPAREIGGGRRRREIGRLGQAGRRPTAGRHFAPYFCTFF
jgi:hypothetical protein